MTFSGLEFLMEEQFKPKGIDNRDTGWLHHRAGIFKANVPDIKVRRNTKQKSRLTRGRVGRTDVLVFVCACEFSNSARELFLSTSILICSS